MILMDSSRVTVRHEGTMNNLVIALLILVCITGLALPQNRRCKPSKAVNPQRRTQAVVSTSTVGVDLHYLTPDHDGGVWITGSAWQLGGLMLRDHSTYIQAMTVPGLREVSKPQFLTPAIGWMISVRSLYWTDDGGRSWKIVEIPGQPDVRSFYFHDIQNGWVGGWNGEIYHTADAGKTWSKQETRRNHQIQQIFFVDLFHGWASSFTCCPNLRRMTALLRTGDGGETWEVLSDEEADSRMAVHSLFFVSASEGWAIDGWQYDIVHTMDAGRTWEIQQPRKNSGWNSLFFINDHEGWAAGGDGILHTSDGGQSWDIQLRRGPEDHFEAIAFTDGKHGWAIGSNVAFRTIDGGITWSKIPDDWKKQIPDFQTLLRDNSLKSGGNKHH